MFTESQKKIIDILDDGKPHHRRELMNSIGAEDGDNTLNNQLSKIRKIIRTNYNEDIVCRLINRAIHYQRVRLIKKYSE